MTARDEKSMNARYEIKTFALKRTLRDTTARYDIINPNNVTNTLLLCEKNNQKRDAACRCRMPMPMPHADANAAAACRMPLFTNGPLCIIFSFNHP